MTSSLPGSGKAARLSSGDSRVGCGSRTTRGVGLGHHSEALGNDESAIINDGGATQKLAHAIAPEELFVGLPPLCNVGVAAPLGSCEVVVDLLHGNDPYVDELDRDGRTPLGIEHREPLTGLRHRLSCVLIDLQETRERGLLTAQDRRHTTVAFRTRKGEFKSRKVRMSHREMVRSPIALIKVFAPLAPDTRSKHFHNTPYFAVVTASRRAIRAVAAVLRR